MGARWLTNHNVQILNADTIDNLNCVMHLRGIMAIVRAQLDLKYRPGAIGLLILSTNACTETAPQVGDHIPTAVLNGDTETNTQDLTCLPVDLGNSIAPWFSEMVPIFARVANLFNRTSAALRPGSIRFESQLKPLRSEATVLRLELLAWASKLPAETRLGTVKRFTQPYTIFFPNCQALPCPTLRADSYTDCK